VGVGVGVRFGAPRRYVSPVYLGVPVVAPFGYYSSYGSYGSYYTGITPYAEQQPSVVVVQQPAPVYVNPPTYYSAPAPQPQASNVPPSPMLVFHDRSVYSVTDYWVAGDQLVFTPSRGLQKMVPLASLDLDMTQKVNEACNIPFELRKR